MSDKVCSVCGAPAPVLGERESPGTSMRRAYFCGEPKCAPKEPGWTMYELSKQERA